jgi:ABC-type phosphate transport system substrate-binding protein
LFAALLGRARASAPDFVVIVHPDNAVRSLSSDFLEQAFLKRRTEWDDKNPIKPVDLAADSGARARFSERVLRRSVTAVKRYWQQRIFAGRGVPPPELDSDQAVVAYVLQHRGGIGYVSGGAALGSARAVAIS